MNKESLKKRSFCTNSIFPSHGCGILVRLLFTHITLQMDIVSSYDISVVPLQRRGPSEVSTSGYGSALKHVEFLVRLEDVRVVQTNIGN